MYRTHTCGELSAKHAGQQITLAGWVNKIRNLGGMTFIDLRDRYGITQVVCDPEKVQQDLSDIKAEFVLQVTGEVIARPDDMINKEMKTGEIEINPTAIKILSKSKVLPFPIVDDPNTSEENRFKHRFLDLRRRKVLRNVEFRTKMTKFTRDWFTDRDFLEVQTPIFTVSSPE